MGYNRSCDFNFSHSNSSNYFTFAISIMKRIFFILVLVFILGGAYHPLTGYHFFLGFFVILFLHFPFFAGMPWTLGFELRLIALFLFFWMIEDFLWFMFNPNYGLKKFKEGEIPWHQRWIFGVPFSYYKFLAAGLLFYLLSFLQ